MTPESTSRGGELAKRHRRSTRLWHWLNAFAVVILLMSGLTIFNAHPRLYWGQFGANQDAAFLEISSSPTSGNLRIGDWRIETTGLLGNWRDSDGNVQRRAFPGWATIPSRYNLALARRWHIFFAWLLGISLAAYLAWSLANRHMIRDLSPRASELHPRHLWHDIKQHALLRFPTGAAALRYNILQKLAYLAVLVLLLPVLVLTGMTMSPGLNAAWPWLLDVFGGRQSARSLHFMGALLMVLFVVVHLLMVLLAGPFNEIRSMITGNYRLPKERKP
ncbi:MAG: cytochrome b/b6 domain-containing protein [Steroidobacteraceae bacterium]